MQSSEAAPKKVIDETVKLYQGLLNWAPSDQQLSKPSFGVIHESVRRIVAETRILRDVFLPVDLAPPLSASNNKQKPTSKLSKTWDRREKAHFVQRLLDFVAQNGHTQAPCSAAKLASGLEPIKVNELLQALARVASGANRKQAANTTTRIKTTATKDQKRPKESGVANQLAVSKGQQRPGTYTRRGPALKTNEPAPADQPQANRNRAPISSSSRANSIELPQSKRSSLSKDTPVKVKAVGILGSPSGGSRRGSSSVVDQSIVTQAANATKKLSGGEVPATSQQRKMSQPMDINDPQTFAFLGESLTKLASQLIILKQSSSVLGQRLALVLKAEQ